MLLAAVVTAKNEQQEQLYSPNVQYFITSGFISYIYIYNQSRIQPPHTTVIFTTHVEMCVLNVMLMLNVHASVKRRVCVQCRYLKQIK